MPRAPKRCGRLGCSGYGRPYCPTHTAEAQARANTAARGYGADHEAERARWQPMVDAGQATCHAQPCWERDPRIAAGAPWHLGHNATRTAWTGPEHPRCNTRNAARSKRAAASR